MIEYLLRKNGVDEWGIYALVYMNNGRQENLFYNLGKIDESLAHTLYDAFYVGRSA